jgi:sulfate adenylyltransferase
VSVAGVRIMCTLGPASLDPKVIRELDARRVDLLRINLSHTRIEDLRGAIDLIRACSGVPISLDTEGAQVRCGSVVPGLVLETGSTIDLLSTPVQGDAQRISLRPRCIFETLEPNATMTIDFQGADLRVIGLCGNGARALVERGGRVESNRAVTISPFPSLPPLTRKDVAAIELGRRLGIGHYALSFAASKEDVGWMRELIPPDAHLISKIESRAGVRNMDEIIVGSDAVLIDRGDLSREVPLEEVPFYQKEIVRRANRLQRPVYVATNLLESMVVSGRPTVAEANDIANTLLDGAHGLVLAAETAIGIDPVGSVDMVLRCISAFERTHYRAFSEGSLTAPIPEMSASVA